MSSSPPDSAPAPHPAFTARPSRLPPCAVLTGVVLTGVVPAFLAALIVTACGLARWHGERAAVPHGAPA